MVCPNPECGIEMDPSWHADVVFRDVVFPKRETPPIQETPEMDPPSQTFRYFECQRCHQFVVVEL